ncbi:LysE family translocator [Oleidesulfovibrio alaskensis]
MTESVLTLLTICFFARMTPGPDMLLIIRHATAAPRGGAPRAAYACVLGVCAGLSVHVALSVLGLALVLKTYPLVFRGIQIAGALYLLYIAARCLAAARGGGGSLFAARSTAPQAGMAQGFRDGLFCNLLNPKVTLFVLSVFTQFVSPESAMGDKALYGGVIVAEALVGWALFVRFLDTPFIRRVYDGRQGALNLVTGLLLGGLGSVMLLGRD